MSSSSSGPVLTQTMVDGGAQALFKALLALAANPALITDMTAPLTEDEKKTPLSIPSAKAQKTPIFPQLHLKTLIWCVCGGYANRLRKAPRETFDVDVALSWIMADTVKPSEVPDAPEIAAALRYAIARSDRRHFRVDLSPMNGRPLALVFCTDWDIKPLPPVVTFDLLPAPGLGLPPLIGLDSITIVDTLPVIAVPFLLYGKLARWNSRPAMDRPLKAVSDKQDLLFLLNAMGKTDLLKALQPWEDASVKEHGNDQKGVITGNAVKWATAWSAVDTSLKDLWIVVGIKIT